jgi:hypothetical protein
MGEKEFQRVLDLICKRGEEFIRSDKSAFTSTLDESELTTYAAHCLSFLKFFQTLKNDQEKKLPQLVLAVDLARVIAFWQVFDVFRTLHERRAD